MSYFGNKIDSIGLDAGSGNKYVDMYKKIQKFKTEFTNGVSVASSGKKIGPIFTEAKAASASRTGGSAGI